MSIDLDNVLSILTIVALLAVVVGDRMLGWLRTRGIDLSKVNRTHKLCESIQKDTQELIRLFDDSTLEDAIKNLSTNIGLQTQLLQQMVAQTELSHDQHRLIMDQMARLKK